jgi:hypothetical protein
MKADRLLFDASDVLGYASSIIVIFIAAATAMLALKQYKMLNRTYIIPIRKRVFFYAGENFAPHFLHDNPEISLEDSMDSVNDVWFQVDKDNSITTSLRNIGKGTASEFKLIVDYNGGKEFYKLMSLLGYENYYRYQSNFDPDIYRDVGIFSSDEAKDWVLPHTIGSMIRHICETQYDNHRDKKPYELSVRTKYKLASIKIITNDIMDLQEKENVFHYDLMVEIDNSMAPFSTNYLYSSATITFVKSGVIMP